VRELETGHVGDIEITQGFVLFWAVFMTTAIATVPLARVLPYAANRWANIIVGGAAHRRRNLVADRGRHAVLLVLRRGRDRLHDLHHRFAWTWRAPARIGAPAATDGHRAPTGV
jgi:hypothetical protein